MNTYRLQESLRRCRRNSSRSYMMPRTGRWQKDTRQHLLTVTEMETRTRLKTQKDRKAPGKDDITLIHLLKYGGLGLAARHCLTKSWALVWDCHTVCAWKILWLTVFSHPVRNFSDRIFCLTPLEKEAQDG